MPGSRSERDKLFVAAERGKRRKIQFRIFKRLSLPKERKKERKKNCRSSHIEVEMELLGKTEESKLDKNSRKRIVLTSEDINLNLM